MESGIRNQESGNGNRKRRDLILNSSRFLRPGFTLLEMLVSIGIFSVVVVSSIGVILSISAGQLKASNIQNIQDNIRFALELMTKELRQAGAYLPSGCGSPNQCAALGFVSASGQTIGYCLDNGLVKRTVGSQACIDGSPVTSDGILITRLLFYVVGYQPGLADGQPRVTIVLEGHSKTPKTQFESSFNLETTITRRLRDF